MNRKLESLKYQMIRLEQHIPGEKKILSFLNNSKFINSRLTENGQINDISCQYTSAVYKAQ